MRRNMCKLVNSKEGVLNKAFTLIELLAVIIILAIVALIATPIILDVIDDARRSAGLSEAQMIYSGINDYCAMSAMENQLNGAIDICEDGVTTNEVTQMVNLGNANVNKVTYNSGKIIELIVESNGNKYTLSPDGSFVVSDIETPDEELTTGFIKEIVLSQFPYLETSGNGCVTANDNNYSYMGGCYLKGNPTNNYIWYSGFLWRIMGINADGSIKMIVDETLTTISYVSDDSAFAYDNSNIKEWLNDYFYNRLKGSDIIIPQTWCSELADSTTSVRTTCTNNLSTIPAKVGLITADEYNLVGGAGSYLDISQYQHTMTPSEENVMLVVYYRGEIDGGSSGYNYGVRPVINVDPNAFIIGGDGTVEADWNSGVGPFILNEDKRLEVTGYLNNLATSGEYVLFADKKYRVVDKDINGNVKLILDGYYDEELTFGTDNHFTVESGLGLSLNTTILEWLVPNDNTSDRAKLVTNYTWYQNIYDRDDHYEVSLNEINPTNITNATVGLIRVGEMLAGQSSSALTNGYTEESSSNNTQTYWTLNMSNDAELWYVHRQGFADFSSSNFRVRPVIVINVNTMVNGGNGTWSNPYKI